MVWVSHHNAIPALANLPICTHAACPSIFQKKVRSLVQLWTPKLIWNLTFPAPSLFAQDPPRDTETQSVDSKPWAFSDGMQPEATYFSVPTVFPTQLIWKCLKAFIDFSTFLGILHALPQLPLLPQFLYQTKTGSSNGLNFQYIRFILLV